MQPELASKMKSMYVAGFKGLVVYLATSAIVFGAVSYSHYFARSSSHGSGPAVGNSLVSHLARSDAAAYALIVEKGYFQEDSYKHGVAYFPGYPIIGHALRRLTGLRSTIALLVIANLALLGACAVWFYNSPQGHPRPESQTYALLAMLLLPGSTFFRLPYSESLFLLLTLVTFAAMRRDWHPLVIAVCIGAATGTRLFGVCLLCPFCIHLWQRQPSWPRFVLNAALVAPVAVWGLSSWMIYQHWQTGDALAFVKAQSTWETRPPNYLSLETVASLLTLEPIRATFDPAAGELYWASGPGPHLLLFDWDLVNLAAFGGSMLLLAYGWKRRWLTPTEISFCVAMLLMAYVLQGPRAGLASYARYAAVVFPVYTVIGEILTRSEPWAVGIFFAVTGAWLAFWSAAYVAGQPVF